jgi:hypothetical protein
LFKNIIDRNTLEISSIGSIKPCGKFGADATSLKEYFVENCFNLLFGLLTMHVFLVIALRSLSRSTSPV